MNLTNMPIVQKYRDCKCTKDCFDHFQESVHYSYWPLQPDLVGVMDCNEEYLYIMTDELFWENFVDEKRLARRQKKMQGNG